MSGLEKTSGGKEHRNESLSISGVLNLVVDEMAEMTAFGTEQQQKESGTGGPKNRPDRQ